MSRYVELSHVIDNGMPVYPGLPAPRIDAYLDHEQSRSHYHGKAEFYIGRITTVTSIGTYLDIPFHRYIHGEDLSQVPLESVAGLPGIALDAVVARDRSIAIESADCELRGHAVLVRTGWDENWTSGRYFTDVPYLAPETVNALLEAGARLVGVDFANVDDMRDPSRPAHTRLLGSRILIVENLCNLKALPRTGFRFYAVPPRVVKGASFPVRAFAELIK